MGLRLKERICCQNRVAPVTKEANTSMSELFPLAVYPFLLKLFVFLLQKFVWEINKVFNETKQ